MTQCIAQTYRAFVPIQ